MTWRAIHVTSIQVSIHQRIDNIISLTSITAKVFNNARKDLNIYGDDVEVDYRGYEVCLVVQLEKALNDYISPLIGNCGEFSSCSYR